MSSVETISNSPGQTQRLGRRLGALAEAGDVFLLSGELGSGKTCLVQGIAWGLGVEEYATSPSFVLVRPYEGRLPLYHIDFYRLDDIAEIADLGLEEYLWGDGVCAVEWAEKALALLPEEHLLIRLEHVATNKRRLLLEPRGNRYIELLSSFSRRPKRA